SSANAAALFALGATALAAAGAIRRRTPVVATALVASLALLVAAASWSSGRARDARAKYLPADAHWVDHAAAGEKTMLVVGPAWRGMSLATLFWNPSVARVVQLPTAASTDCTGRSSRRRRRSRASRSPDAGSVPGDRARSGTPAARCACARS